MACGTLPTVPVGTRLPVESSRPGSGGSFQTDALRAALESIRSMNRGGLKLGYGPDDRTGLELVDLSIVGADGRFMR